MHIVDYRIFEYAQSEFEKSGPIILVALRIEASHNYRVLGYLHFNWKKTLGQKHSFDRQYIEDFVYDLRQQEFLAPEEVSRYFQNIQELSVGPLRTACSGVQTLNSLSASTKSFLEQSRGVNLCSEDCLSRLIDDLTSHAPGSGDSCRPVASSD